MRGAGGQACASAFSCAELCQRGRDRERVFTAEITMRCVLPFWLQKQAKCVTARRQPATSTRECNSFRLHHSHSARLHRRAFDHDATKTRHPGTTCTPASDRYTARRPKPELGRASTITASPTIDTGLMLACAALRTAVPPVPARPTRRSASPPDEIMIMSDRSAHACPSAAHAAPSAARGTPRCHPPGSWLYGGVPYPPPD